ncbi:MAG: prolyl oligopeptidase family serine peptidase [Mycobacteriales bacterium]
MTSVDVERRPDYPAAERLDLVERRHGLTLADPYRWLEDPADPRTAAWSAAQDELARGCLDGLPGRDRLAARLTTLHRAGSVRAPSWRGGRRFFTRREPGQEHEVLLVGEPDGTERVLVDPGALDPAGTTTLDAAVASHEGDRLAYQLSTGGDEESRLYVLDVGTGGRLDGPIDRCRYSPIAWLPGGEELYYVRRLAADAVPAGEEQFHRRVWRHRVGADPASDVEVHGAGLEPTNYYGVSVSRDGRWLLVTASAGTAPRDDVWIADLDSAAGDRDLREIQVGVDARVHPWIGPDGLLYLSTDRDAPRGRLARVDPADPAYERWVDMVPEQPDEVLGSVALLSSADDAGDVGTVLAVHTRDAADSLSWWDARGARRRGTVARLDAGSVVGLTSRPEGGREAWIGYTDHVTPPMVLRWSADAPEAAESWARAPGAVEPPAVRVNRVHYSSADGTRVHMFVVAPAGEPDRPRPTVLYGYGGFNNALTPTYTPSMLAWVEAGGVWAIANLRGGSEHGEEWHRAGMRERKQNVFDDYIAAAERLLADGWTTRNQLGIYGGSNGGLLVGAALTQRPDLYAAVVCSAPLLDMVRYELFGLGRTWNDEYGSADDPEELGWLAAYSPYHRLVDGVDYPAVLFTTFDSDTRVDPLHARKMCAALQHATAGTRPVLLRRERDVGHGARSVSRSVRLGVDQLAFLADRLGLPL